MLHSSKFFGFVEIDGVSFNHPVLTCIAGSSSKCIEEMRTFLPSVFTHDFLISHDVRLCVSGCKLSSPLKLTYYA